jgi:hypothetical protein
MDLSQDRLLLELEENMFNSRQEIVAHVETQNPSAPITTSVIHHMKK